MAGKKVRVEAPVETFTGVIAGVAFADGVAEFDPKENPGAHGYFQTAGYRINGKQVNDPPGLYAPRPTPTAAAPGTPDNPDGIIRGPSSNDAAVVKDAGGPMSDAFMPPTNAGEADPHGPLVVSPGIHAVPPAPIVPGPVSPEAPTQEKVETAVAHDVLVEGLPATTVADPNPAPTGPLGLSDPASAAQGQRDAAASGAPSADDIRTQATKLEDYSDEDLAKVAEEYGGVVGGDRAATIEAILSSAGYRTPAAATPPATPAQPADAKPKAARATTRKARAGRAARSSAPRRSTKKA